MRVPELKSAHSLAVRRRLRAEHLPVFRGYFRSRVEEEADLIMAQTAEGPEALLRWADAYYAELKDLVRGDLTPVVQEYGDAVVAAAMVEAGSTLQVATSTFALQYAKAVGSKWTAGSRSQLHAMVRDHQEDLEEVVEERMAKWADRRVEVAAQREAVQANAAFSKLAYLTAGASSLVWRTTSGACPICRPLEGKRVGISSPFVRAGEPVGDTEGDRDQLVPAKDIGHPPLHGMGGKGAVCQCMVALG